jgi:hypothetical protein
VRRECGDPRAKKEVWGGRGPEEDVLFSFPGLRRHGEGVGGGVLRRAGRFGAVFALCMGGADMKRRLAR